jgi:hypothetical protein
MLPNLSEDWYEVIIVQIRLTWEMLEIVEKFFTAMLKSFLSTCSDFFLFRSNF